MESKCALGLEVLDFRPHYPCFNATDTSRCEIDWPCELREYWLSIHTFIDITRGFLYYGTIVIITLGLFLNSISFYVLISSGLAKNGSGLYLLALAVCDCGNLITNYSIGLARAENPAFNQYFLSHEWLCRFHGVFVELFQTVAAWIVVGFTIERCLAVWYPMTFRSTRKYRSKIVVGGLTMTFTIFCLSKLFLTGFEKDSVFGYTPCHSQRYVWPGMAYIRVAFQTWIPTILVFVFNCLMFWKLKKIKMNRKRLTAYRKTNRSQTTLVEAQKPSFIHRPCPTTPMLIAVSLAYLVLVFPLGIVQTFELYWNVQRAVPVATNGKAKEDYINWVATKMLTKYIRSFCFGFYQLNFAINFFLYFAAGVQFRVYLVLKVLKIMKMCGLCTDKDLEAYQRSTTSGSSGLRTMSRESSDPSNKDDTSATTLM